MKNATINLMPQGAYVSFIFLSKIPNRWIYAQLLLEYDFMICERFKPVTDPPCYRLSTTHNRISCHSKETAVHTASCNRHHQWSEPFERFKPFADLTIYRLSITHNTISCHSKEKPFIPLPTTHLTIELNRLNGLNRSQIPPLQFINDHIAMFLYNAL
jgi:hypothetical protein